MYCKHVLCVCVYKYVYLLSTSFDTCDILMRRRLRTNPSKKRTYNYSGTRDPGYRGGLTAQNGADRVQSVDFSSTSRTSRRSI